MSKPPLRERLRNPDCKLCPLHKDANHVCLIGDGIYPARALLVGEAPGFREDNEDSGGPGIHKPFQGRAGELLDSFLETFELPRSRIFLTNAVKCRPVDKNDPRKNGKPNNSEIGICSSTYLRKEIRKVHPKIILALGGIAAQAVLGSPTRINVGQYRNRIWYTQSPFLPDIPVIVTYHPAAALYNDDLIHRITEDFEFFMRVMKHGPDQGEELDYKAVTKIPSYMFESKKISLDLETDGFSPMIPGREIISIQLCHRPGKARYIRWSYEVGQQVKRLLADKNKIVIGHNVFKFDRKWLKKKGINIKGEVRDTLMGIHLLDENFPGKDLETVASAFTPLKSHKKEMEDYLKAGGSFKDTPLSIAVPYGCGDADASLRLEKIFTPRLKKEGLWPLFRLQMRAGELYTRLELSGIKVDTELIDEMVEIYEKKIDKLQEKLNHLVHREVNPNSFIQVGQILYKEWKFPARGEPKKYRDPPLKNTAEDTLLKLLEMDAKSKQQRKFIEYVLELRALRKTISTYILGLSDHLTARGFVHPNYLLHGTVTGRSSCRDPNLQNIPRDGYVKRLFVSRYGEEGCLLQFDVSQGELRWAAHYSEEETLIKAFRSGTADIHTTVAAQVLGIKEAEVTKAQRKKAKTVNFGILYGGGAPKMAIKMGCSVAEAQDFIYRWSSTYSGWEPYKRRVTREVIENGYVVSDFGRIRHLPIVDPNSGQGRESIRQAINSPIQGSLHDFTVLCGCNAWDRVKKREKIRRAHIVADVHDAWLVDCHRDEAAKIVEIFLEEFSNPDFREFDIKLKVPMLAEASVGPNWKELVEWQS